MAYTGVCLSWWMHPLHLEDVGLVVGLVVGEVVFTFLHVGV